MVDACTLESPDGYPHQPHYPHQPLPTFSTQANGLDQFTGSPVPKVQLVTILGGY